MNKKPLKIFYMSSTHWDREWYKPFQKFRFKLVETIDGIIKTLEDNNEFTHFMLDGQTSVLEDYLEIVPEKKERLTNLIRSGRISIGPWYTMPDEFLVSGESLIANLKMGHNVSKKFGVEAMKFGYACDIFGHIAQMPQIFNEFGISGVHLGRGVSGGDTPGFFKWISLDGSCCITHKSPEVLGYGSFCAIMFDYLNNKKQMSDKEILEIASEHIEDEIERCKLPYVVLMDGLDHQPIHARALNIVKLLSEKYECPVVFDPIKLLTDEISAKQYNLVELTGELNETGRDMKMFNRVIRHTLSSRYDIKKANDEVQNLLEKWTLPLTVIHMLSGNKFYKGYENTAYNYLLKNHAHDSICGCSVDEVHQDMHYRFRQAKQISGEITEKALSGILGTDSYPESGDENILRIYNPLPFNREETISVDILFEDNYPTRYSEGVDDSEFINAFRICDFNNNDIAYQINSIRRSQHRKPSAFHSKKTDIYNVTINGKLPAMGYAQYKVIPSPTPQRQLVRMGRNRMTAENEFLFLRVNGNGTFDIEDKITGKVYSELGKYTDSGETGDGWSHVAPKSDIAVYSEGAVKRIEKINDGVNSVTFRITTVFELPEGVVYYEKGSSRSAKYKRFDVTTCLTLGMKNNWVDCETVIENTVLNHFLKVEFPTGIKSDYYYASQAFGFVKRRTGFRHDTGNWNEDDKPENNFGGIVYKSDPQGCGIAFISSEGLHECSTSENDEGEIAITLLRTFNKTHQTDGETDGLLSGEQKYRYRLMPFGSNHVQADFIRCRDTLAAGVFYETINSPIDIAINDFKNQIKFELIADNIVMSVLKTSEEDEKEIIVRLFNCSEHYSTAELICPMNINEAYETDMLYSIKNDASFKGNILEISLGGWKIGTYKFVLSMEEE